MYGLQGPLHLKQYTPAQIKQALHTQPGITYAQITKQNSYAATNIEQDQHINQPLQQTSDIGTRLKKYDEKPFSANGNYAKPHNCAY
jgi:hypothetical protein